MNIVVLVTAKNKTQANKIAKGLVEERLAACVNIVGPVTSVYRWKGRIAKDSETMLIIKTQKKLFKKVQVLVKKLHTYDVPEVIALPITMGSKSYLDWIEKETS